MAENRTYEEAIAALKTLPTNAATIAKSADGTVDPAVHALTTISQLKRVGLTLDEVDALNVLHVTGTKGKGSTAAFCESILRHHGFTTGTFSAPHLISERERIRLDGRPLDEAKFVKYFFHVYDALKRSKAHEDDMPFYFGFMTVMALYVFVNEKVDVSVLEVRIGGEYDNTNIVARPIACGIACLDFDHMIMLGKTMDSIAWNKAGIFKYGVPAFTVEQEVEREVTMQMLLDRSKEKRCPLYVVPPLTQADLRGGQLGIPGSPQLHNAALAVQMCRVFLAKKAKTFDYLPRVAVSGLTAMEIQGLSQCILPGRYQTMVKEGVTYYLDGAHTQHSMKCCATWFVEAANQELSSKGIDRSEVKRFLIFNVTGKRDVPPLFNHLKTIVDFDLAVFCPNMTRSDIPLPSNDANLHQAKWKEGASSVPASEKCDSVQAALNKVKEAGAEGQLTQVLITGSIHLVGCALSILSPDIFQ